MPDIAEPKSEAAYKKRKSAMANRLKKLGTDNPVVKKAVENKKPKRDAYEDFEIVHDLVSAAYSKYAEDDSVSLKQCVLELADAIKRAAGSLNGKAGDGSADDDDYDD